jgi:hypothetical protein
MSGKNNDDNLNTRFSAAFCLIDEDARLEALRELFDLVAGGKENFDEGIEGLLSGIKSEKELLSFVWARLGTFNQNKRLHEFAESELDSKNPDRRRFALRYLSKVYPSERQRYFKKMSSDSDSAVLYEVGSLILPVDRRAAVETWFRAMGGAPHVLAEEILPMNIGQYADKDFVVKIKQYLLQKAEDKPIKMILWFYERWNSIDYIEAKEPVRIGEGYWIECPNCNESHGVREGHAGERGRCRFCGEEFIISNKPDF